MLYDYKCANGHIFEVRRSRRDKSQRFCPICNAPAERIFSGMPAIHWNWWNARASSQITPAKNDRAAVNKKLLAGVTNGNQ
jgi:putative FmdB family regulatory protein